MASRRALERLKEVANHGPEQYSGWSWTVGSVVFFFSSRRRHTRFDCDWSSDVCSSDLSTLSGTTTVATVNGVASFSTLTLDKTGTSYALTATAIGLSPATSSVFSITPGGATQLVFGTEPGTTGSEEHTSELQSQPNLVCRLLLETKNTAGLQHRPV